MWEYRFLDFFLEGGRMFQNVILVRESSKGSGTLVSFFQNASFKSCKKNLGGDLVNRIFRHNDFGERERVI